MRVSPGDRIEWQDWRDERWVGATVVRVERLVFAKGDDIGEFEEVDYPVDLSHQIRGDGPRLAVHADFYADDPYYLWPCRWKAPDLIRPTQAKTGLCCS